MKPRSPALQADSLQFEPLREGQSEKILPKRKKEREEGPLSQFGHLQLSKVAMLPGAFPRKTEILLEFLLPFVYRKKGFPDGLGVKNLPANAGDIRNTGLIPGSGRSPGEGNGNPLQYSCLENPMDRGAWRAIVHRVAKGSDMTEATEHARTHI